jgi:AsmA protein
MRTIRIIGIAAVAVVPLSVAGALALAWLVDANEYRGQIERLVRDRTGRRLTIGGKLEFKLFPWLALSVQDLKLGSPPAFAAEPFIAIRTANIGVPLLPLLRKHLEVRNITVDGLNVNLVRRGHLSNWTLGESSPSTGASADKSGGG